MGIKKLFRRPNSFVALGLVAIASTTMLQGCTVQPVAYVNRPHCHHCRWHNHHWRRNHCWVNRRGVMHCR